MSKVDPVQQPRDTNLLKVVFKKLGYRYKLSSFTRTKSYTGMCTVPKQEKQPTQTTQTIITADYK